MHCICCYTPLTSLVVRLSKIFNSIFGTLTSKKIFSKIAQDFSVNKNEVFKPFNCASHPWQAPGSPKPRFAESETSERKVMLATIELNEYNQIIFFLQV